MPRYIPIQLKEHLRQDATTTCMIIKITPIVPGYPAYGITALDQDVIYDNGDGEITYHAAIGMVPASLMQSSDLSVDNTELPSLLPEFNVPIDEADIRAGVYDQATSEFMLVNYEDLGMGHVMLHKGSIGQVTINTDGLSFVNELRGLAARLKQSVCSKDSLSCRAIFGSQPIGSAIPGPQVARDWCGYPAETLLQSATVTSVGLETNRTFGITPPGGDWAEDSLNPGIVKWVTGLNAGKTYEVESNTVGGTISLAFETAFPIQTGDQLQFRPDCTKMARDDAKGCRHWFEDEWVLHFRGEPDIPIGDAGALETPGASSGPGQGGMTTQPVSDA